MEDSRIERLEKEVAELKAKLPSDKIKKERKPRAPSEYNEFIKNFILQQKTKLGDKYDHKTAFKLAAEAWSNRKKQTSQN